MRRRRILLSVVVIVLCSIVAQRAQGAYTSDRFCETPIVAGRSLSFAVDAGLVWGWGTEGIYELLGTGLPPASYRLEPAQVANLEDVVDVAAGYVHTLALKEDGTVWAWGSNHEGQLGIEGVADCNKPTQVPDLNGIVDIAAGNSHSLAVDDTGIVWGWGLNSRNQLGDGTTTNRTSPVQVADLTNAKKVAASYFHSLAIDDSGNLYSWGWNVDGILGHGGLADANTPVLIEGLSNIVQVDAGVSHSIALDSDGHLWAWGNDMDGQIGEGETWDNEYAPVQLTMIDNIVSVAAGKYHNVAVDEDGKVWAWGDNEYGQVGDGTTDDRFTPVHVSDVQDLIVSVAAGQDHSLAVSRHGEVFGWGRNNSGELGNGTKGGYSEAFAPVKAIFHHKYHVLVVMLTREEVGTDYSDLEEDIDELIEDFTRYSYGKLAFEFDLAGPYISEPNEIGCTGSDAAVLRQYSLNRAYAEGVDLEKYNHVIVAWHDNLIPECSSSYCGGVGDEVYDGGVLEGLGMTVLCHLYCCTLLNRHHIAHEFLHAYGGDTSTSHNNLISCDSCAAYVPDGGNVWANDLCTSGSFYCGMNIMASPSFAYSSDNRPNVNGVNKYEFAWVPRPNVATVIDSNSFDLYPSDTNDLKSDKIYLVKVPVLGPTPTYDDHDFILEYRKEALIGKYPEHWVWPGVYLYINEQQTVNDNFSSYIFKTQPDDLNTWDGMTPLSEDGWTFVEPAGFAVKVAEVNEDFARVNILLLDSDITLDCDISIEDVAAIADMWLQTDCNDENDWCDGADVNHSGGVTLADFAELGLDWSANSP